MAYKTKDLEKQAIDIIREQRLICIEDIVAFMDCSSATFYNHKLENLETIKAELRKIKAETKVFLRKKMYDSDSPADRAMLYKLCSSEEELAKISMQNIKTDITTKGESLNLPNTFKIIIDLEGQYSDAP